MTEPLTVLIVSFILLSSNLIIGIFSKTNFLPALANKSSDPYNSNNTRGTEPSPDPNSIHHLKLLKKHSNSDSPTPSNNATTTTTTINSTANDKQSKSAASLTPATTATNATHASTTNATQSLSCSNKDLLKCYFKMIFRIKPAPEDRFSDFIVHITNNPRHIADFPVLGKSTIIYLSPGNYDVYFIYKGINQGLYCSGIARTGATGTCPFSSPNLPPSPGPGPGTLLVAEAIRFLNGSFPTKPSVTVGTVTIKGNDPQPAHFQVYDGDDEEGREVTLGPGKYMAAISLPKDFKLAGTNGACSGTMTKGSSNFCHFSIQQTATSSPGISPGKPHPRVLVSSVHNSIKNLILTNPNFNELIQKKQQQQLLTNASLIQLDTIQLCKQLGNQTCVSSQKNFKVLFANTTKDSLGDWVLFGKVQNNSSMPLAQIRITLYLYDTSVDIVGLKQGSTTPQNLNPTQERESDMINMPKFFRIYFDCQQ
jgi:hypothetical protein